MRNVINIFQCIVKYEIGIGGSVLPGNFSLSLIYIIRSVLLFKFEALSYGSSGSVLPGNFSLSTFIIECLAVQI